MRTLSLFAIALLALRHGAQAQEAGDEDLDLDDDLEDDGGSLPGTESVDDMQQPAVEAVDDFDLGMSEDQQKGRMGACFSFTLGRVQARKELMEQTVKEMAAAHKMKPEQAMNALLFTWMMTCYMNIEDSVVQQVADKPIGTPLPPDELEEEMFGVKPDAPQSVQQASKRQWTLLESTLQEHAQRNPKTGRAEGNKQQQQKQGGQQSRQPQNSPLGSNMDKPTGILYVLVVFGVIFGAGMLVVLKLMQNDKENSKDKGSRADRKAEKEERKSKKRS